MANAAQGTRAARRARERGATLTLVTIATAAFASVEHELEEAASEKYRLISREQQPAATFAGSDELPEALKALIIRGAAIYERVRRLDETMYETGGETAANPVSEQLAKLTQAFGR